MTSSYPSDPAAAVNSLLVIARSRIAACSAAARRRGFTTAERQAEFISEMEYATVGGVLVRDLEQVLKLAHAMLLVDKLRAEEGHGVTINCDNSDFNGLPNCCVEVVGDWTNWEPREFRGATITECLLAAVEAVGAPRS